MSPLAPPQLFPDPFTMNPQQLVFEVTQDDGVFVAVCHAPEMATQADSLDELEPMIRDLVECSLEDDDPRQAWPVRLHFVNDPVLLQPA